MALATQLGLPSFTKPAMQALARGPHVGRQKRLPHPIPYQGSKRNLAPQILTLLRGRRFERLIEPFAGSAAITIAAASQELAQQYILNDSLQPLAALWQQMLTDPEQIAAEYRRLWQMQMEASQGYYTELRRQFNRSQNPVQLLYLLARCVKNAPRFNRDGAFNQSADKRRLGMHPDKMAQEICGVAQLLANRTTVHCADFAEILEQAVESDVVYLDPPYVGTSSGANRRYHQGLARVRLIDAIALLNRRGIPFLLSYDGRCGDKAYGPPLPDNLGLTRFDLIAGRSAQATLNGRTEITVESLYASAKLAAAG